MTTTEIINVFAIVLSPVIAVLVSMYVQSKGELKKRRYNIFLALISTRHSVITEEQARAFNSIDVIFHDCETVRKLWREYFDILTQPNRLPDWGKKKLELLKAMADEVGYKKEINHLDLDRIYTPTGLIQLQEKQTKLLDEFLKAFDSGSISITAKKN